MNFPVVPDQDFLTTRQACEQLGVTPMRLNKLVQSGSVRLVCNAEGKHGYSQDGMQALLASGMDLGPSGPLGTKGMFRRARRKIAELGLDGFFDSLG